MERCDAKQGRDGLGSIVLANRDASAERVTPQRAIVCDEERPCAL